MSLASDSYRRAGAFDVSGGRQVNIDKLEGAAEHRDIIERTLPGLPARLAGVSPDALTRDQI